MTDCRFEQEVLDAIASRRWPARADEELRAHVSTCESCADLAAVAGALLNEDEIAWAEARVPSSGAVWHRAQLRAREEAARAATRPIGFVQGVAFACTIAAAIAVAVWGLPILGSMLPDMSGIAASLRAPSVSLPEVDATRLLSNTTLQIAAAVWVVLVPLALYFTLRDTNS